jgi:hypothetical protein
MVMVEAENHCRLLPTSIWDIYKEFEHPPLLSIWAWGAPLHCCNNGKVGQDVDNSGSALLGQIMPWCHGWGCKPLQTASVIHIWHLLSVWASSNAVHMHMHPPPPYTAILTASKLAQILIIRISFVRSKWCHDVMVEVVNHYRLLPTIILDM